LYLSANSGRLDEDVTAVFDELQSEANRKKIAVTTSDGVSECYVELERWDHSTEQAWLWVNVPSISNITNTDLYLYYSVTQDDNTAFVDDTGTGNSSRTWNADILTVLHLNQTPSGAAGDMTDSSLYSNHGTTEGSMNASSVTDAPIGSGLALDEIDDLIRIPNSTSLSYSKHAGTFELWINWDNASDGDHQIVMTSSNRYTAGVRDGFEWASQGDGDHFFYPWAGNDSNFNLGPNPFTNNTWHHLVVTFDNTSNEVKIYIDSVNMTFTTENVPTGWTQLANASDWLWGGNPDRSTRYFHGLFDEIRIHNVSRSSAWIQASYETSRDNFLNYSQEETHNFSLDLEVQWTDVDYSEVNEELCLYVADGSSSVDATGGYLRIGDGSPDWGSPQGTISFWVKMDDAVQGRCWGQSGDMETRWSGTNLTLDWGNTSTLTSTTTFSADQWYFIAIVWNETADDLLLYVGDQETLPVLDGSSLNGTWTNTTPTSTENRFLNGLGGNEPVNGHGDDLRYWNISRTLQELQSDYNASLTGSESGLRSYFPLDGDNIDQGPNSSDGVAVGSTGFSTDVPFWTLSAEALRVDVWTGSAWQNVMASVTYGWNNVTVASYLTSSTFTIRYQGGTETNDLVQDRWFIDVAVLHVWS
jgi:hypothetical protein